jgi:tripartite motif-containing protein 71
MRFHISTLAIFMTNAFTANLPAVDLVYVTTRENTILTYDTTSNDGILIAGTAKTFINTNLSGPNGLAFDSKGNLYVVDSGKQSTISKFDTSGNFLTTIGNSAEVSIFTGVVLDSSDNIYAASSWNSKLNTPVIYKFNSTGVFELAFGSMSTLAGPSGLVFDSAGNLYVANSGDNSSDINSTITKFNVLGDSSTIANGRTLSSPTGLAMDSTGNLYAANNHNNTISKFDSTGNYLGFIGSPQNLNYPAGIAIDSSGNLYAANIGNNSITKFDPLGNFQASWSTGTTGVGWLAFKPITVPEPSTCALSAIAAGLIAFLAIRRRYKSQVTS